VILKNSGLLSLSPDGGFFAYASRESGKMEVYVRPFPTGEGKWIVSTNTGRAPRWSPKGDEIFYMQGNDVMAAKVELRPGFRVRGVEKVSTGVAPWEYDVMPDGKGFITTQPASAAVNSVVLVENWLDEVWRKR
jgi:Tol biopolymer transport system component